MKKMRVYLTVFIVVFCVVTVINNYIANIDLKNNKLEMIYGNEEEYVFSFDEKTIAGKKIVVFDNNVDGFIRYNVAEFSNDQYVVYSYYFLKNELQYLEFYRDNISQVVDYSHNQLMIKTLDYFGDGTYDEVMVNLNDMNNNDVYLVY